MALVANVDASGVGVDDCQLRIARGYPPSQFPTLCAVHAASLQPLECGHLSLGHAMLLKSVFFRPRLGSACEPNARLSNGVSPAFFKAGSPPINTSRRPKSC